MRLMIVGSDKIFAIENFYLRYLKEAGTEVSLFTAQSVFFDYYQKSLFNKLKFRAGLSGILGRINEQFRETVSLLKPDVIWLFKGMEITPASLKWAKEKRIKLVNYNPDNPFIFTGKGSGNSNVSDSIPLFDMHFTYNLEVKERMEKAYNIRTELLPFGFDIDERLYQACAQQEEVLRVCFLGNPDKQRAAFIASLAEEGVDMDIYGNDWDKVVKHPRLHLHPAVYGDELWKVLRKYRVQLNLMRIHNEQSHNMRSFEVPGIGGIMLAPDTIEHRMYFQDGKEVFLYRTLTECRERIKDIIGFPHERALEIRENARTRSLRSGYSYKDRALQALSGIYSLMN